MQIYRIEIRKKAAKFINSRNKKEQNKIIEAIYNLPNGTDIIKMAGYENRFRLRVGDIRIIYEKIDNVFKIIVIDAGNRGDIYK